MVKKTLDESVKISRNKSSDVVRVKCFALVIWWTYVRSNLTLSGNWIRGHKPGCSHTCQLWEGFHTMCQTPGLWGERTNARTHTHRHTYTHRSTETSVVLVLLLMEKKRKMLVNQPGREGWIVDKVKQLLWISNWHETLHGQVKAQWLVLWRLVH